MTSPRSVARHKTAIRRQGLSRPIQLALDHGILPDDATLFDYGCGHGEDIRRLRRRGFDASGWDPMHHSDGERRSAEVVNLGYVVNVIENPRERAQVLADAWSLTESVLVVSARLVAESRNLSASDYSDGVLTSASTFQKFYEQEELRNWVDSIIGEPSVSAGLGVLYVFRDLKQRESFLATRFRRRSVARPSKLESQRLFEAHRPLFDALMDFLSQYGRLPSEEELPCYSELVHVCRSLRHAYGVLRKVAGDEHWATVREQRAEDLLVYIALSKFRGRPRFGALPISLQRDIRAFFGTYKKACQSADEVLFSLGDVATRRAACRQAPVGKLTPSALYVHRSALERLPPALRIYEGCARALVGEVEFTTLVKLHYEHPKVSYLEYPDFDRNPHPPLGRSLLVDLRSRRESLRDYRDSENPPILHRKEEFVADDYSGRMKFARLTEAEEQAGLLAPKMTIGTLKAWKIVLDDSNLLIAEHQIIRRSETTRR